MKIQVIEKTLVYVYKEIDISPEDIQEYIKDNGYEDEDDEMIIGEIILNSKEYLITGQIAGEPTLIDFIPPADYDYLGQAIYVNNELLSDTVLLPDDAMENTCGKSLNDFIRSEIRNNKLNRLLI